MNRIETSLTITLLSEGAAQQEARHNTALADWQDFKIRLDELTMWLEDVQEELSSDIPKITGGKQLEELNSKQQVGSLVTMAK